MSIYKISKHFKLEDTDSLKYKSPLGNIFFDFLFNNNRLSSCRPMKSILFDKTSISYWNFEDCEIEFLCTQFAPKIPLSMKVEDCIAGIWRVKSLTSNLETKFKVNLESNEILKLEENGSPENGEGLITQSYENKDIKLSIGTEDEEYLSQRANQKYWIPERFHNLLDSSMLDFISGGIQIELPNLNKNEFIQIQFIISWALKKYSESSTWYAVDQRADYILNQAGVK